VLPTGGGFEFQTDEEDAFGPPGRRDECFQLLSSFTPSTTYHL
jgi:hypothetical protein